LKEIAPVRHSAFRRGDLSELMAMIYDAVPSAVTVPPWRPEPKPPITLTGLTSHCIGALMNNSPYLDRPLLPLAVALPRMLQEIEAALAAADLAEVRRLRQRVSSAN